MHLIKKWEQKNENEDLWWSNRFIWEYLKYLMMTLIHHSYIMVENTNSVGLFLIHVEHQRVNLTVFQVKEWALDQTVLHKLHLHIYCQWTFSFPLRCHKSNRYVTVTVAYEKEENTLRSCLKTCLSLQVNCRQSMSLYCQGKQISIQGLRKG